MAGLNRVPAFAHVQIGSLEEVAYVAEDQVVDRRFVEHLGSQTFFVGRAERQFPRRRFDSRGVRQNGGRQLDPRLRTQLPPGSQSGRERTLARDSSPPSGTRVLSLQAGGECSSRLWISRRRPDAELRPSQAS